MGATLLIVPVLKISNNTGLLLLCEAQLGNPMYEQGDADSRAAQNSKKAGAIATKGVGKTAPTKWEDASIIHPQLKGVKMVCFLHLLTGMPCSHMIAQSVGK